MIRILLVLGFLLLLGNLLVVNYFVFQHNSKFEDINTRIIMLADSVKAARKNVVRSFDSVEPSKNSTCDAECVAIINAAVDDKVAKIKIPTQAPAKVVATTPKTREWIIPVGAGVINDINTWTDIYTAQAQVDTTAYPPIQQAYFEVIMHIPNGTGEMSARLYDTTTPYLYAGQVLSTTSSTGQLLSVPFPIQSGVLNYHVQLYTSISQGVLDSSRIRLVTQ